MSRLRRNLKHIVAAGAFCVAASLPAFAQETALDGLYSQLAEAEAEEAKRIERQIWKAWSKSGSASIDLLLERGRDALEEGETDVAIEHFTALTDHAPDFAEGYNMRATAYFTADLFGPALADLQRALELEPRHFGALFGLGIVMLELGYNDEARAAFDRVASIHPHYEDLSTGRERLRAAATDKEL